MLHTPSPPALPAPAVDGAVVAEAAAIDRSHAVIAFAPDGTILRANDNFLRALGYEGEDLSGQPHRIFMPDGEAALPDYHLFWAELRAGRFQAREFRRRHRSGRDVWIQAAYNPVLDTAGRVVRVVKVASDISAQKQVSLDMAGQIDAIRRSQAVIAFDTEARVLEANDAFLALMGYASVEVVGQPHAIFVDPAERDSPAYAAFWARLRAGEFQAARFRRRTKSGAEVWIQAT